MSIGTKVVGHDMVVGYGHKPAPWHGKTGTVVSHGGFADTVWVQFGSDFGNACHLFHMTNLRAA